MLDFWGTAEWLEADGLGGFAMGTASGERTRRYHGILLSATTPPSGRIMLVSGFDAWLESAVGREAISTQRYWGDVRYPDGAGRLESFDPDPWPRWRYRLRDGAVIEQSLFVPKGLPAVCLRWTLSGGSDEVRRSARLVLRPLLAARDYHCLQHENAAFRFDVDVDRWATDRDRTETRVTWRPYADGPRIISRSNGEYHHKPDWFRQFLYSTEADRGLDCLEDLASPGTLIWDLSRADALWLLFADNGLQSESAVALPTDATTPLIEVYTQCQQREVVIRSGFPSSLHRAADAFLVRRGAGETIIAGYPWFTDWGRDAFIALRGLCLATNRLETAKSILLSWAATVSDGMLPNRFPDHGEQPEFNAVDASLWFVIVVHEFFAACDATGLELAPLDIARLRFAVEQILNGYERGTRFGIRLDADGLIAAGEPRVQLTWMDAKVGDWVVTPRIGKPVDVQALWLNALWRDITWSRRQGQSGRATYWEMLFERGRTSFNERFWNPATGTLFDVVDVDHQAGAVDTSFRPNQIFAAGGLPLMLLPLDRAKQVVDAVADQLWTPLGLRSLAPSSPGYSGRYDGSVRQRDATYHQGTAWAWLLGPFVEAWIKTRPEPIAARREANVRFLEPLWAHRHHAGLGHVSEIADGDAPHTPRGCPFQAWSLGELLRLSLFETTDFLSPKNAV